jgi:hypothetical protein
MVENQSLSSSFIHGFLTPISHHKNEFDPFK